LTPPTLPIAPPVKKGPSVGKAEKPSKVARVLKLLNEKESPEAGGPVKAQSEPTLQTQAAVEVIKAPPSRRGS
jgi:hypothetical protein